MSEANSTLTQDQLKELFGYDPETGIFTNRIKRREALVGKVAGHKDGNGYLVISIYGDRYKAHRLAWMYVYGGFPPNLIDHINGNKTDNRIANLRLADRSGNGQNMRKPKSNSPSGLIGAFRFKNDRWRSQIRANGKTIALGCFDTAEEAHQAYLKAKRELHPYCTI